MPNILLALCLASAATAAKQALDVTTAAKQALDDKTIRVAVTDAAAGDAFDAGARRCRARVCGADRLRQHGRRAGAPPGLVGRRRHVGLLARLDASEKGKYIPRRHPPPRETKMHNNRASIDAHGFPKPKPTRLGSRFLRTVS